MKALIRIGLIMVIVPVALTGCWNNEIPPIEPTAESCRPDFYRSLPSGKQRDNLVEACMTQGQYRTAKPQTFQEK